MPIVQIKDVPAEMLAVLRRRAAAAHQSLQEYLRARLIEEADPPSTRCSTGQEAAPAGRSPSPTPPWRSARTVLVVDASVLVVAALAESLDATLVTADARLAHSPGPRCPIDVLT